MILYMSPIQIIAELSANHQGSLPIAIETIKAAHESGATMIKAQAYTPDKISAPGYMIKKGPWPNKGLHPMNYDKLIGKKSFKSCKAYDPIQ